MSDHCFIFHTRLLYQGIERKCQDMKKLDPFVIIVDLVLYLYVTNYKDNHYGGRFHKDF